MQLMVGFKLNLKEMNKLNLFFTFLAIVILSSCSDSNMRRYAKSPDQILKEYLNDEDFISPGEILKIAEAPDPKYHLIDIRTPDLYIKGHLKNAINVPLHDALNPKYKNVFSQGNVTNIIYGTGNEDVVDLYLMFNELGVKGNKFFKGGYIFVASGGKSEANINDEKPAYNFAEKLKELAGAAGTTVQTPVKKKAKKPVIRRKKREVEGGCS